MPKALNDRGEVTGELRAERDAIFVWSEQHGMRVPPMRFTGSNTFGCYAHAINNAGQVTGNCGVAIVGDVRQGIVALKNDGRDVQGDGSSINDTGKIVGHRAALNGGYEPFLYDPCCGMQPLMPLDAGGSVFASFINASGQVIGFDSTHNVPFVWLPESGVRYLDPAADASERAYATALTDNGIVLLDVWREIDTTDDDPRRESYGFGQGISYSTSEGPAAEATRPSFRIERHAYLYDIRSGQRSPIGHLPGGDEHTQGHNINRHEEVVGGSGASQNAMRAFYWHPHSGMHQLDQLIETNDPYDGIALHSALGINAVGQILAIGVIEAKPFLLTPVQAIGCEAPRASSVK